MRLIDAFAETARRYPEKLALITEKSQLSFNDIIVLAAACEANLRPNGLRPGMRLVLTTDRPEFVLGFTLLASRLSLTLILAQPRALAGVAFDLMVGVRPVPDIDQALQVQIEPGWFGPVPVMPSADFATASGAGAQIVFATSGSTGTPKLVAYSEALVFRCFSEPNFQRATQADAKMRLLMSATMATVWGMMGTFRALLAGGSTVALDDHRNRPLQYIDLFRVSHFETTPMVIRQMLDVPAAEQYLSSLREIVVGGAFASTDLMQRLSGLTDAPIDVAYGTSEFGALALARFQPDSPHGEGYLGEVFRNDIEIAFFDEALRQMPGAGEGIVGFRNRDDSEAPAAYLGSAARAEKSGFIGGYFFPGDVMRRVGNQLYVIGRVKNVINVGGNKIALEAVQTALESALAVQAVACLAVPDALGLEELVVAYTAPESIPAGAVQAVLDAAFPGLHLRQALRQAALPFTPSGKIDYEALRRDCL